MTIKNGTIGQNQNADKITGSDTSGINQCTSHIVSDPARK
jgi:hypothetical protein